MHTTDSAAAGIGTAPGAHRNLVSTPPRSEPPSSGAHQHDPRRPRTGCRSAPTRSPRERTMGRPLGSPPACADKATPARGGDVAAAPTSTAAAGAPFGTVVRAFYPVLLEVLDRRRPQAHLHPYLTRPVNDMLASLAARTPPGRHLGAATLGRVHAKHIGEDSAETMCTYHRGQRTLAIAARFDLVGRRPRSWLCTSLLII